MRHKTNQRKPSGARGEETTGIAITPKGSHRRRGKDLSNIDNKHTRVE
jgi:hypothetical protein